MDFKELAEDFAARHGLDDLPIEDNTFSLEIDDMLVMVIAMDDDVRLLAEIGDAPPEGKGEFADMLLQANMESKNVFLKNEHTGKYMLSLTLPLSQMNATSFDTAIENLTNTAENWSNLLKAFCPIAQAAAEQHEIPEGGLDNFIRI